MKEYMGLFVWSLAVVATTAAAGAEPGAPAAFRAGAAAVDVSPTRFPVLVNGGFLEAKGTEVRDPLRSSALVLDDGATRLAIVVVDSCMMPRELLDEAKAIVSRRTGLPPDRVLISATHTHTAPAAMGALGCAPDPEYVSFLPGKIAESIARAVENLAPAEIGWASVVDADHTHCRRWIRRPDRLIVDPFGQATGRAHMHPGYLNPDAIGPSGPVDPELSIVAVRAEGGRPLALLANYSMHYFGTGPVSADYYGKFCDRIARRVGARDDGGPPFVAMMSQGTSGDQHWMDYGAEKSSINIDEYAEAVASSAMRALEAVTYRDRVTLAMAERTLRLRRRTPDSPRLAWARPILDAMGDRPPRTIPEVYAREAQALHDEPVRELKLQAIRVGDLGIAAIPNEVYALTGLKIKARSPLPSTFNIELANGSEGYIPPPEQHTLGGYTTWPARTAALEVEAEPRIVEAILGLLEEVSGLPRRRESPPRFEPAERLREARPWGFWRLEEMDGAVARDDSGHGRHGRFEDGFALHLEGLRGRDEAKGTALSRAVHLAGGRLVVPSQGIDPSRGFVLALAFWNGLPADARPVCGTLVDLGEGSFRIRLGGSDGPAGRLSLTLGRDSEPAATGSTLIETKRWYTLALISDGKALRVLLDGKVEIDGVPLPPGLRLDPFLALGGSDDPSSRFEGKLDEVALFDRAPDESLLRAVGASSPASGVSAP